MVLLTHRIYHVDTIRQTLQALRIGLYTVALVGRNGPDVLQLRDYRMQTRSQLRTLGISLTEM